VGYQVALPATWKYRNAGSVGDHSTELWYDPSDPLNKLEVVASACAGCVEDAQTGNPSPSKAVPAGATQYVISPTKVGYLLNTPDNSNPDNGLVVLVYRGSPSAFYGYYAVDLFLPEGQHQTATAVLNSFNPLPSSFGPTSTTVHSTTSTTVLTPATEVTSGPRAMPSDIQGYQRDGGVVRDVVRVFEGNPSAAVPLTFSGQMNGCGTAMWTARWRSLNPDVTVYPVHAPVPGVSGPAGQPYNGPKPNASTAGYLSGFICTAPGFLFGQARNGNGSTLVDVVVEWQYWAATP
jgi:hypothetical protein